MTSEIAIMNKEGIALAADSAVTIGGEKIYNSANKLFELTKKQPISIMIYGNATFMGIPWETIIKIMRNKIHSDEIIFKTLEEARDYFYENIRKDYVKATIEDQKHNFKEKIIKFIQIILNDASNEIQKQFAQAKFTENAFNSKKVDFLKEGIKFVENNLNSVPELVNITIDFNDISKLISELLTQLETLKLNYGIFDFNDFNHIDKKYLLNIIINYLKREMFLVDISGIVISGFGTEDIYPKLSESILEINYGNFFKYKEKQFLSISDYKGMRAAIIPFGQDGDVHTFLRGIHPNFQDAIILTYQEQIHILISEIGKTLNLNEKKIKKLNKITLEFGDDFQDLITDYSKKNHIHAIIDNVINLPKNELCEMAESLVNLMSFKQKVTSTLETVGGPIDTAFISKGDGFIWIKRKHYFDPKLNHNFFK